MRTGITAGRGAVVAGSAAFWQGSMVDWPANDRTHDLVRRFAELVHHLGDEFGKRPLVLPTSHFFPDTFTADALGANRVLKRMRAHAGMSDIPLEVELMEAVGVAASACSSNLCAAPSGPGARGWELVDQGSSWLLRLPGGALGHPVGLTTLFSQGLAAVFIEETRSNRWQPRPPMPVTLEMIATGLGFGALLMEGAYIYSKACGGPHVDRATTLSVGELAVLAALFSALQGRPLKSARKVLNATQSALLRQAQDWLAGNAAIVSQLKRDPASLCDGHFRIESAKSHPFASLGFGRSWAGISERSTRSLLSSPPEPRATGSVARAERSVARDVVNRPSDASDDIKALVAEAFGPGQD